MHKSRYCVIFYGPSVRFGSRRESLAVTGYAGATNFKFLTFKISPFVSYGRQNGQIGLERHNVHDDKMHIFVWIPVRHGVHLLNHVCVQLLHPWPWIIYSRQKAVLHGSVFNFKMMWKCVDQSNPELSNPGKSPASCAHYSSWLHTFTSGAFIKEVWCDISKLVEISDIQFLLVCVLFKSYFDISYCCSLPFPASPFISLSLCLYCMCVCV